MPHLIKKGIKYTLYANGKKATQNDERCDMYYTTEGSSKKNKLKKNDTIENSPIPKSRSPKARKSRKSRSPKARKSRKSRSPKARKVRRISKFCGENPMSNYKDEDDESSDSDESSNSDE